MPTTFENDVTNDFALFDHTSWNDREFIFAVIGYDVAKDVLPAILDIAKWDAVGPVGGYFHLKLLNV